MADLFGIVPPIITPFTPENRVDFGALSRFCADLVSIGVHGLFLFGSAGEGTSLASNEKREAVRTVRNSVGNTIGICAGISAPNLAQSLMEAEAVAGAGADFIVSTPPFYYKVSETKQLIEYFTQLADRSPLPLLLYNIPGLVGINLKLDVVQALSEHPRIIGIKQTVREWAPLQELLFNFAGSDFKVFIGEESLIVPGLLAGADGVVGATANFAPKVLLDIYNSIRAGDLTGAWESQRILTRIAKVYEQGFCPFSVMKGMTHALWGYVGSFMRPPLPTLTETDIRELYEMIGTLL